MKRNINYFCFCFVYVCSFCFDLFHSPLTISEGRRKLFFREVKWNWEKMQARYKLFQLVTSFLVLSLEKYILDGSGHYYFYLPLCDLVESSFGFFLQSKKLFRRNIYYLIILSVFTISSKIPSPPHFVSPERKKAKWKAFLKKLTTYFVDTWWYTV